MRTVHFYRWKPEVSITAYCDKYAVSENNILYFISMSGPESAVRGIISAIQMDESITIRSDEENIHCKKGLAAMKSATSKIAYENMTHGLCLDVSFRLKPVEIISSSSFSVIFKRKASMP